MLPIVIAILFLAVIGVMAFLVMKQLKMTDPRNVDTSINDQITTAQEFLPFQDIRDGMLDLGGHRYRAYIECSSINYHLRTEKEKDSIELSFQSFLNSLSHPITIYVQTRIIDNSKMLKAIEKEVKGVTEVFPHLKDYATHYLMEMADLNDKIDNNKQKKKYIIVNFDEAIELGELSDDEKLEYSQKELFNRVNMIAEGLSSIGINTRVMNTRDVAELIYSTYHRENYTHIDNIMEGNYLSLMTEGENPVQNLTEEQRLDWILFEAQRRIETELYRDNLDDYDLGRLRETMETIDALRDSVAGHYKQRIDPEPVPETTIEEIERELNRPINKGGK